MKKVFAGVILPTIAAAAVIGSGFSIWFFGENEVKASSDATVEVTNLLRIGTLESKATGKLVLDQTDTVRNFIAGTVKSDNDHNQSAANALVTDKKGKTNFEANGIHFEKGNDDSFNGTINYVKVGNGYVDTITDIAKLNIVTSFEFNDNLAKYISISAGSEELSKDGNKFTYTWTDQDITNGNISLPVNSDTADTTIKFNYAEYKDQYSTLYTGTVRDSILNNNNTGLLKTAEPHTTAEYEQLVADLKDASFKIETVATIVEA